MSEEQQQLKTPEPQPTQAGQYYLMEKVAQGGMAEIFKGLSYDVHGIKKTVCIKKILPHIAASKEFIDSLIDEAKIAVNLSHGNIAQVYDLGKVGDDYFMVMEFVDGRTLSQISRRCQKEEKLIPVPYLCYFVSEVLNGLNYMHSRRDEEGRPLGIVHRDISPQNIMVSYSGTIKIIDFGIAKAKFKVGNTDSGILKGKFAYMSPEQARGDPLDHRSDIFSLGVIFHEMLVGKRLFKAEDNRQTLRNVRRANIDPPTKLRPELPPELDEIVIRSLAKDRRDRYPYASEMHDELVKFLYTTYPDFQPSDVTPFIMELFKDEMPAPGEERESRTPYLIIDHTSSALVDREQFEETGIAKAPIDVKQYVVGELPHREPEEEEEKTPPSLSAEETSVDIKHPRRVGNKILYMTIVFAVLLAITAISIWQLVSKPETVEPIPPAPTAKILVTTNPSDAKVFLDGELAGSGSPVTIDDISVEKNHLVTVQKDGFISRTTRFKIAADEFKDFSITLKPEAKPTSTITLTSTPPGATVFLDDVETKYRTPATIDDLDPAVKHVIGLHLPNYRFWTTSVTTKPNETQNFHVQLALDYGALRITTEPSEALVLIDGKPAGQTPMTQENLQPDKTYRVEVWKEGFQPLIRDMYIKSGKVEELHLELVRSSTPPPPEASPAQPPMGPVAPKD